MRDLAASVKRLAALAWAERTASRVAALLVTAALLVALATWGAAQHYGTQRTVTDDGAPRLAK